MPEPAATRETLLRAAAAAGIDRLDARLLLQHVCACTHQQLIAAPQVPVDAATAASFQALLQRRLSGEPLAYLVGEMGFYGRSFRVSPAVLVPRPDTELLIETSLPLLQQYAAPRLLDLGTGSGAIAITLALACPTAQVTAVDLSPAALAVAADNASRLGARVAFQQGNWYAPLAAAARFELIVSNPPYIRADDPHLAGDGLRFEPAQALTDGGDGLACLRAIVAGAAAHLQPGGWLLLEHGYDQGAACRNLLAAAGFKAIETRRDLGGNERVSGGCLSS